MAERVQKKVAQAANFIIEQEAKNDLLPRIEYPRDHKLDELREQTKIHQETLDEQKRQSQIMDLWAETMQKQAEILQKQERENKKSQRNNYILTFIFGVATLAQTYFAYLDYKKSLKTNEITMSKKEEQKQEETKTPKKKGRIPQIVERKVPLTEEEEETLKKSEFGRLLKRV